MLEIVENRFDTSPNINDNWTLICTAEEDAKIINYDNKKNDVSLI